MESSRRLLKCGEARRSYKVDIKIHEEKAGGITDTRDESYLESLECRLLVRPFPSPGSCGSLIGFPRSRVSDGKWNSDSVIILNTMIYCGMCTIADSTMIHHGFATWGCIPWMFGDRSLLHSAWKCVCFRLLFECYKISFCPIYFRLVTFLLCLDCCQIKLWKPIFSQVICLLK